MLLELRVENLVLIERAELRVGPGLNVITGETGAGKTMLASALDLLLGGRARQSLVRSGAKEAYVEGVFELTDELRVTLGDRIPEDAEELVLARRVTADGKSRAFLAGRTVTAGELRELAQGLVVFTGQHEHRRLVDPRQQLEMLDAAAGDAQARRRERMRERHAAVSEARAELEGLDARAAERERQLDLARFELEEIERVDPQDGEQEELAARRDRLRHAERLRSAAAAGVEAIDGDDVGSGGLASIAASAQQAMESAEGVDPRLDPLIERMRSAAIELADLATDLQSYLADEDEDDAGDLDAVEQRLAELERLARKHGGDLAGIRRREAECRQMLEELGDVEATRQRLQRALDAAEQAADETASALTSARRTTAKRLGSAAGERLARLAMEAAELTVEVRDAPRGPTGADAVELVLRANPGAPAAPLREVASGGELSRVLLALIGAVGGEDDATFVLDEIDAGIGGRTAAALGEELRHLAAGRQVLCITHLPQVAALADEHATIVKDITGDATRTRLERLSGDAVTRELVRMLGAADGDDAALRHAERLRAGAIAEAGPEGSAG